MENVAFGSTDQSESEGKQEVRRRIPSSKKKRGREEMENHSVGVSLNVRERGLKRVRSCCRTCEGFGCIGMPNFSKFAQHISQPPAKRSKIIKGGVIKSKPLPGNFKVVSHKRMKNCCTTCEGLGGIGLPPKKYLENAERVSVKLQTPPIYLEWLQERSKPRNTSAVSDKVIWSPSWWYAQVCMACLKAVQHISLHSHLHGIQHRKVVTRNGMRPNFTRKIPMLVYPGNRQSNIADERAWGKQQVYPLKVLPKEKFMDRVAELRKGLRCLVLGEQDFSFSNTVGSIVGGNNVIGTCYLSKHDPNIPDVKTLDDGERRFHQQKTLGSMDGDLNYNLALAKETGVSIRYNIDAQNIQGTLLDKERRHVKPFDRIIFPFPRVSLIRGCDPNNSVLIKKYLNSAKNKRCLAQNGLIQLIMLENQFREWDIPHLAEEAGLRLRGLGWMNFDELPYQARDVTGKRIREAAMREKTLYISFARGSVLAKI